ncbi:MAG: tyrosine--tRNA ligase [Christensenellaceae bacterium]|jgi:tyrosyl-tRNA synthetase|nr:tyrosine--tRNA ligase [Christensenellaceae bacterium]
MASHALDVLRERGFIAQTVYEDDLYKMMEEGPVTFYVGFDPTADSLHIGHFIPIMAMMHMQRAGHRPIALLGGGTAMVGDPSGKTSMRPMLDRTLLERNAEGLQKQLSRFLDFSEGKAILANNADWLLQLNYVDFLREIGAHFSVNRMLTAEAYKQRLERGLTFLEFNYMLMQSYDFLELFRRYGCRVQLGGDDQWSNILSGADLIRRKEQEAAFAVTFRLLLTSTGEKMGKTVGGALWLDRDRTSPYDFYQYWRNIDDADVENCLAMLTFLPMDEVRRLGALRGSEINEAKKVLAFELTKIVHSKDDAAAAQAAAEALFGGAENGADAPATELSREGLAENKRVIDLMVLCGLCKSRGEGRRLVQGGGVYVNGEALADPDGEVSEDDFGAEGLLLRKGKKVYHRLVLKG